MTWFVGIWARQVPDDGHTVPEQPASREQIFFLLALTRHEHLVLVVLVRVREDVCALECLWEESEDVVDDQQCGLGVFRASGICLHAIDGDPFAFLFIALAHDWRDAAASLGLRRHVHKSSGTVNLCWMFETCSKKVVLGGWRGGERF